MRDDTDTLEECWAAADNRGLARAYRGELDVLIASAEMSGRFPSPPILAGSHAFRYPGACSQICISRNRVVQGERTIPIRGEEDIVGTAIGGETMQDFNVLCRRGVVHARLDRWAVPAPVVK